MINEQRRQVHDCFDRTFDGITNTCTNNKNKNNKEQIMIKSNRTSSTSSLTNTTQFFENSEHWYADCQYVDSNEQLSYDYMYDDCSSIEENEYNINNQHKKSKKSSRIIYGEISSPSECEKHHQHVVWDIAPPKSSKFDFKQLVSDIVTLKFCIPIFCPPVVDHSSMVVSINKGGGGMIHTTCNNTTYTKTNHMYLQQQQSVYDAYHYKLWQQFDESQRQQQEQQQQINYYNQQNYYNHQLPPRQYQEQYHHHHEQRFPADGSNRQIYSTCDTTATSSTRNDSNNNLHILKTYSSDSIVFLSSDDGSNDNIENDDIYDESSRFQYHSSTTMPSYTYLPRCTRFESDLLRHLNNHSNNEKGIDDANIVVSGWVAYCEGDDLLSSLSSTKPFLDRKYLLYMIIVCDNCNNNNSNNNGSSSSSTGIYSKIYFFPSKNDKEDDTSQMNNDVENSMFSIDLSNNTRRNSNDISVRTKFISNKHGHAVTLVNTSFVDNNKSSDSMHEKQSKRRNDNNDTICTILPISLTNKFFSDETNSTLVCTEEYNKINSCIFAPFVQKQKQEIKINRQNRNNIATYTSNNENREIEKEDSFIYAPDEQNDAVMHIRFALDSLLRC